MSKSQPKRVLFGKFPVSNSPLLLLGQTNDRCIIYKPSFSVPPDMHCYSLGGPGRDTKQMSASQEHQHFEPCLGFVSTILSHTSETTMAMHKPHYVTQCFSTSQLP